MPLIWPIGNLAAAVGNKKDEKVPPPKTVPIIQPLGALTSLAGGLRSYLIACFCIYYFYPKNSYPGLTDQAETFKLDWMMPIMMRNLIGTIIVCGFWDWFLYFSPLKVCIYPIRQNSNVSIRWRHV